MQNTINLPLTISIDNLHIIKTWVDAAYGVHNVDMKSQTGIAITMDKGVMYSRLHKQKLNVKKSTESKLVGASDFVSQTIWTCNFIKGQGYKVRRNAFYQDNLSAMSIERNEQQSAGQ